jgi:transcriptional regulator with XRE-family HTH domain
MTSSISQPHAIGSGVNRLDILLGGLFIGDNVVWHDDAGSLAWVFCFNFMKASQADNKPIIYVSFDRSPRNILEKLGPVAQYPGLTVLDCFTWGKGAGSDVFLRFYYEARPEWPCRIVRVDEPRQINQVMDALYGVHAGMSGDVRFVFESITGMQELWGGEDQIVQFYGHSCPRLYELNTVAYWIMEKNAHSSKLKAQINQIAQVAIDLSIKRGTTSLSVLKAENRSLDNLQKPFTYWTRDHTVTFDDEQRATGPVELGARLRKIRVKRGFSQTELARLVGVTPSTISQVESSLIYPSLPALLKIAEVLSIDVSSLLHTRRNRKKRFVFPASESSQVKLEGISSEAVIARVLTPVDLETRAEPFLIEIAPDTKLSSHFFIHKGEEMGYVLEGSPSMTVDGTVYELREGDLIYLTLDIPTQWHNPGPSVARLLWTKIR